MFLAVVELALIFFVPLLTLFWMMVFMLTLAAVQKQSTDAERENEYTPEKPVAANYDGVRYQGAVSHVPLWIRVRQDNPSTSLFPGALRNEPVTLVIHHF